MEERKKREMEGRMSTEEGQKEERGIEREEERRSKRDTYPPPSWT